MKNIFRQAAVILVFLGLWYLFFLFLTYLFYPDSGIVDDSQGHHGYTLTKSIYPDGGPSVDLGFWVSPKASRRIIITGSSDAEEGILPCVLQTVFPHFAIYNATVGGSNVAQLRQIVDVIRLSPGSMKGTIFIIGIFYGTFFDDNVPYQHFLWNNQHLTKLQTDGLRYGLYQPKGNGMELTLDARWMPWAVRLLRPFLFWHIIFLEGRWSYFDLWTSLHSMTGRHEDTQGEGFKQSVLEQWEVALGDIKGFAEIAQMNSFVALCREITQSGASVVVVELPVPRWLKERSVYYKKYILNRPVYLNGIKNMQGVRYIDLGASLPRATDSDFRDSVHPTQETAKIWTKTIADFMVSSHE